MLLSLYRLISYPLTPFLRLYLNHRLQRGKEHPARIAERWGHASRERPHGTLAWIHAASVGEAQSALPLIHALLERHPELHLLLTTGTVSSAEFVATKLPDRAFHQFVPVDTWPAARRFVAHWQPDVVLWVESELWPNLLTATRRNGAKILLVNARMSEASFHNWQRFPTSIKKLLSMFDAILAQAPQDAARLTALGAQQVQMPGNLKEDAGDLPFDAAELERLKAQIGSRPLWLAASTHSGEEAIIAAAHKQLLADFPQLLTLIVPRHPPRGEKIAAELQAAGLSVASRSRGDAITSDTATYLADTIGELGLFYRLAPVVFMGGSLIPHGGQNPLEAARLDCALLAGIHTHNFEDIFARLESAPALIRVTDSATLAAAVEKLLSDSLLRDTLSANAKQEIRKQQGALAATLDAAAACLVRRKRL